MNYIKRLQSENDLLRDKVKFASQAVNEMNIFLHSAKFTGTENGERKDWISTGDVIGALRELSSILERSE